MIAILIAVAVCLGFSPVGGSSAEIISNESVSSGPANGLSLPEVRRYHIDAGQSSFMVHASVGGLLSGFGHNHNITVKDISGETEFTDGTVAPASLHMKIQANSLVVTDKVSDKDRQTIEKEMREQVLETGKYSEITFNSTKIEATKNSDTQYQAKIWGDLTLHGVTHNVPINAQLTFDYKTLRARGEFALKMSDYSIKAPSVAGGTITVKDTLKFNFNIFSQ
jgi:polyisoprenoid-binding protein YceI